MEIKNDYFEKLNLRVGKIKAVQPHPKTKDYILLVDIGRISADKQVVADLADSYSMTDLIGKSVILVTNTEPVEVDGIESIGLLLVSHFNGKKFLIEPDEKIIPGIEVCGFNNVEFSYNG